MSKKVYHLKHSTHREQYRHMKNVMQFKAELKQHQADFTGDPIVHCVICGNPVESHPMKPGTCYDCYRNPKREQETIAAECERINQWLSDNWEFIPEIPFGEGV